ncbi:CD209 antigen-like protein C [Heterodontus francisci]|uniref:CD209 antigen-like protein C n=1 Tax=Heterodontus francisci TaxID=7792 RepID=UPI00355B78DE
MELNDHENIDDLHPDQFKGERRKQEELKPEPGVQSAEPVHGKWSPLVIYIILALSILLSGVGLGTAFILFTQMLSEMKTSDADLKMELSQLKSNVTGMSEETRSSLTELGTKISQLPQNLPHFQCPAQWIWFRQNCYYFSPNKKNWTDAQKSCALMDANLVVINSAVEQAFIETLIAKRSWIGLSDSISEGDWRWVDGTDYTSSVKLWNQGEPNNSNNEDCVEELGSGKWNDMPCGNQLHWICEKSAQ